MRILAEVGRQWRVPQPVLVTTAVAARMLSVTARHLRRLARDGDLPFEPTPSGQRIFRRGDVLKVAKDRANARGQRREELLADVRPRMLRAGGEPRQTRLRVVRSGK